MLRYSKKLDSVKYMFIGYLPQLVHTDFTSWGYVRPAELEVGAHDDFCADYVIKSVHIYSALKLSILV